MGPRLRRIESRIRCFLGDHELVTDVVPAKPADNGQDAEPARIRLRCLHCSHATPGWEQGSPAYRRTYAGGPTAKERAAAGTLNVANFGLARKRRTR